MDFSSPDLEEDFPGLYASASTKKSQDHHHSDYSDEEKVSKKELLISKRKDRKESKKDKGYVAFEGESSDDEMDETKSPGRQGGKKTKATFIFSAKDKKEKSGKKDRDGKDSKKDDDKDVKDGKKDKEGKHHKKRRVKLGSLKQKKKKHHDEEEEKPIFGVPLQVAVERNRSQDGIELPVIVRECIDYIEEHGLSSEGIYRLSGVKSKVQQLRTKYNRREQVFLYEHEPHIIASLLKQFLRELPEPVLTNDLMPKFEEAAGIKDIQKKVETLQKLLQMLPNSNYLLLSWVFVHMLHVIQHEKRNKMNLQNVSIVLSPAMQISHRVLHALFEHSSVLFKGVQIKKYSPMHSETSRQSLEMPDTPATIEEELAKQETILNQLHAELNAGLRDKQKEEQLWEVQRIITQLKRKLRFLKQMQDKTNQNKSKPPSAEASQETAKSNNESKNEFHIDARLQAPKQSEAPQEKPVAETQPKDNAQQLEPVETKATESKEKEKPPAVQPPDTSSTISKEVPNEDTVETPPVAAFPVSGDKVQTSDSKSKPVRPEITESASEAPEKRVEETSPQKIIPSIPKPAEFVSPAVPEKEKISEEDAELLVLLKEERMLLLQQEELILLGEELKKKINTEQLEVERLKLEIMEYQQLYKYKQYSFDSSENSSSSESDSSESVEEEDLQQVLEDLIRANKQLEENNADLSIRIQKERECCMDIKVQMKILQQEGRLLKT